MHEKHRTKSTKSIYSMVVSRSEPCMISLQKRHSEQRRTWVPNNDKYLRSLRNIWRV